jgi:hypothetical protein
VRRRRDSTCLGHKTRNCLHDTGCVRDQRSCLSDITTREAFSGESGEPVSSTSSATLVVGGDVQRRLDGWVCGMTSQLQNS